MPLDIVADRLVPLMHLSYHLTLYKSRGLEAASLLLLFRLKVLCFPAALLNFLVKGPSGEP